MSTLSKTKVLGCLAGFFGKFSANFGRVAWGKLWEGVSQFSVSYSGIVCGCFSILG